MREFKHAGKRSSLGLSGVRNVRWSILTGLSHGGQRRMTRSGGVGRVATGRVIRPSLAAGLARGGRADLP